MAKPKFLPLHNAQTQRPNSNTPLAPHQTRATTRILVTPSTASSPHSFALFCFICSEDQTLFFYFVFFVAHSNTSLPSWRPSQEGTQTSASQTHHPAPHPPPPRGSLHPLRHRRQLGLTMTEICRMCICSSTISEGSWRLGGVALESCSALLMDTWKYRVPFSSHCCFQCTSEMSDTVPDISAGTQGTAEGQFAPQCPKVFC